MRRCTGITILSKGVPRTSWHIMRGRGCLDRSPCSALHLPLQLRCCAQLKACWQGLLWLLASPATS